MSEILYETDVTWPASDKPHVQSAFEFLNELAAKVPEFHGPHRELDVRLEEREDGTATFSVKVVNTAKKPLTRRQENFRVFVLLALFGLLLWAITH